MGSRGRKSAASLSVVSGAGVSETITPNAPAKPPRKLGRHGAALWASITLTYDFSDAGHVEQLCQACLALDRAEQCRDRIDRDGEMIDSERGPKEHPLLRHELANRAFVTRTLQRLGLET